MPAALFGITDDTLNLVVNLLVLSLVVVWFALIAWTYFDARRRIEDPVLVMCATGASLFPFVGTIVYSILRPPEFLADRRERELEIRASELRVRQLEEQSCPNCGHPVERTYLRCPSCRARIKHPCETCGQPVDPRWSVCPFCETALGGAQRERRAPPATRRQPARTARQTGTRQASASRERPTRKAPASTAGQARSQDSSRRTTGTRASANNPREGSSRTQSSRKAPPKRSGGDDEPRPARARKS